MKKIIFIMFLAMGMSLAIGMANKGSKNENKPIYPMSMRDNIFTKTIIPTSNLRTPIFASLREFYPDYYIIGTYKIKITKNGLMAYQVQLEKGKSKVDIYYDKNGKFLFTNSSSESYPTSLNNWLWDYKLMSAANMKPGC